MNVRKRTPRAWAGILTVCLAAMSYSQQVHLKPQAAPSQPDGEKPSQHTHAATHAHGPAPAGEKDRVPDFIKDARKLNNLPPVLSQEELLKQAPDGHEKDPEVQEIVEAYKAAREIPRTLAQLPCYCYCDKRMEHKSLHSCFITRHAAFCKKCCYEALLAYELQKEGLSVQQIRERIVKWKGNETPKSILRMREKAQPAPSAGRSED